MMKKYAYALAGLLLAGCTGDLVKLGAGQQLGEFRASFTLQGKVMDARTGAPLGGEKLVLKLIQGTDVRDPARLIKDLKDPLAGEYAFSNIPLTTQDNAVYKLVALNDGYIRFEAIIDFTASYPTDFPLVDTVYNYIGDIYMQPTGASAPDITVNVTFNGKPVNAANVILDPVDNAWGNGTDMSGYTLSPNYGYVQTLTGSTNASGQAVFAGTGLGLGVVYTIRVNPMIFENIPIQDSADGSSWWTQYPTVAVGVVGYPTQQSVAMVPSTPGYNPYGLYIVDATNKPGTLDPSGKLVLTFSRPVVLTGNLQFKFYVTNAGGGVLASNYASSSLSTDGKVLTLTPNWTTQPSPSTDRDAYVSYSDAYVTIQDYPDTSYNIFGLVLPTGNTVDRIVQITTPN